MAALVGPTVNGAQRVTRRRLVGGLVVATVLGLASACVPQGPPMPTWLDGGCYSNPDSASPQVDVQYLDGRVNTLDGAVLRGEWVGGVWNASADGTCTGPDEIRTSLVRAPMESTAAAYCTALGHDTGELPLRLAEHGYDVPADAWLCVADPPIS